MWYFNTLEEKIRGLSSRLAWDTQQDQGQPGFQSKNFLREGRERGVEVSDVVNPTSHKGFGSFPSPLISFVEVLTITGASWPPDDSHRFFMCVFVCTHPLCVLWGVSMNTRRGLWVFWS